MPGEKPFRLTIGTCIALVVMLASGLIWAGTMQSEMNQAQRERAQVLLQLKELSDRVQDNRITIVREIAELKNRPCTCRE